MTLRGLRYTTFLRFLVVGGGLAVLYATLAAAATSQLALPKAMSSGIVWIFCIPVGFWCHRKFTFVAHRPHPCAPWLYAATQVLSIGIAAAVSFLLARGVFWPDLVVHLFASALAAVASYLVNRRVIFPDTSAD